MNVSSDNSPKVTDELINTITHLSALIFAFLGAVLLIVHASVQAKPWHIVGFSIYGIALMFQFLTSTLHHGVDGSERANRLLRTLDYTAIFVAIAGTLTPVCLVLFRGVLGWSLLGVCWIVAIAGVVLRSAKHDISKSITTTIYVTMGWLTIVLAMPLLRVAGIQGMGLILGGGVLYTIGGVVFMLEKPNPLPGKFGFHEIWHLFVIAAALCHYMFMYFYVLPHE